MTTALDTLQAEVLRLPRADRAKLLDRLIASLDADATTEAAWDEVADQREAEAEAGTAAPASLEAVVARLEARFPG